MKISNPDKVLYKEANVTKLDVAEYYQAIHEYMLPYIVKRPLSLVRCPDGYDKQRFFQKHIAHDYPQGLFPISIKEKTKTDDYIYLKNEVGLLALAQMGTLEIHPWGSSINNIEKPDTIIFDLDPAPDLAWSKVVDAALLIKDYLKQLKLKSFVKTTGGKGLHVVIPIKPKYDWDTVKEYTHAFVLFVASQSPDNFVTKMTKSHRTGKIFLDYLRNGRGATAVAPYSLRANKEAGIATPLEWSELSNNKRDNTYTIKTIMDRMDNLKKDPWRDYFDAKQSLNLEKLTI